MIFQDDKIKEEKRLMKYIKRIDELYRTKGFKDATFVPQGDTYIGADKSRFVQYGVNSPQGWQIVAMQPMDEKFRDYGKSVQIKEFLTQNSINNDDLHLAIKSALDEMGKQRWIDEFDFPSVKFYAMIYLGKIGIKVKGKYYSPRFLYKDVEKTGDSFWIAATSVKTQKKTDDVFDGSGILRDYDSNTMINQSARAISIYDDTTPDEDIKELARIRINASKKRKWELERAERIAAGLPPQKTKYRQYLPDEFRDMSIVIRDPKVKTQFIIFDDQIPSEKVEEFARKSVTGEYLGTGRKKLIKGEAEEKVRKERGDYFNLLGTDSELTRFSYYNTDPTNRFLNKDNFTTLILTGKVLPVKPMQSGYREVVVKAITGPSSGKEFTLRISVGDKMRIQWRKPGREKAGGTLSTEVKKAPVTRDVVVKPTPVNATLDKTRIAVEFTDEEQ